jgi:NDP-4-keto-2,6-dideoxyhexose 3-C-methyltransferase
MYTKIKKCRICKNTHLTPVLNLGTQMLTGVFPKKKTDKVTLGPISLVKCDGGEEVCGLLQLEHSFDLQEMYGINYGYRSGLNASMVLHLRKKIKAILESVTLKEGDLVLDIGSNDSTTLQAYPPNSATLVGIDPTGVKFYKYYPSHVQLISDFFSSALVSKKFPGQKAKIITSFSMFYDLEDPMEFMRQINDVLADDGVWVFEQSYMPYMLERNSYDTICHEHLEFYSLRQIKWMTDKVGLKIIDVEFNEINGGSFSVRVVKAKGDSSISPTVKNILDLENKQGLCTLSPYLEFAIRVKNSKQELLDFLKTTQSKGKTVAALGASTKGNVLLQYCELNDKNILFVGEVNNEKYGCFTPGTWIPIIPESDLLEKVPDYLIVLPWHFKDYFLSQEKYSQFNLVFPLPKLLIVESKSHDE